MKQKTYNTTPPPPPPPHQRARLTRFSLWSLVLPALFVICAQAQAQPHNDADPAVSAAQAKPSANHKTIWVLHNATANSPYTFEEDDFPFTEVDDDDDLDSITIKSLPSLGTLRVGSSAATVNETVATASIGTITYYPEAGQSAQAGYTSFTFSVTTAGESSANNGTITISLRASAQVSATGAPRVGTLDTGASGTTYSEDTPLQTALGNVSDLNGIDSETLKWQWEQSATETGAYAAISGETTQFYQPMQEQVGQYIRVCVSFMDLHSPSGSEGPLCSASSRITAVSDWPVGGDSAVWVASTASSANPHRFVRGNFPFEDEDGDTINGIRIITPPERGTLLVVGDASVTIAADTELTLAQLDALAYYPEADAAAGTAGYATLAYRVLDTGASSASTRLCRLDAGGFLCETINVSTNQAREDATLTINLMGLSLRLRLFLEGPLR